MINKDNNAINTIEYPRIWEYLIITSNKDELQEKIKEKFHTLEYKFECRDSIVIKYFFFY